jgi:hypothetical protein
MSPSLLSQPLQAVTISSNGGITPKHRARAAIIGAFVADAATMPLHLLFDQTAVECAMQFATIVSDEQGSVTTMSSGLDSLSQASPRPGNTAVYAFR